MLTIAKFKPEATEAGHEKVEQVIQEMNLKSTGSLQLETAATEKLWNAQGTLAATSSA
jgi:hypothetical protein